MRRLFIIRKDLHLSAGKLAAMVGHCAEAYWTNLIKNKYCFDNNIPLIRIPYNAEYTIDDLKLETTRFLLTPENEEEYYNSRGDKNVNNNSRV